MKAAGAWGSLVVWGKVGEPSGEQGELRIGSAPIASLLSAFHGQQVHLVIAYAKKPISPADLPGIAMQCSGEAYAYPDSYHAGWSEVTPGGYDEGDGRVGEHCITFEMEDRKGQYAVLIVSSQPFDVTEIVEQFGAEWPNAETAAREE